MDYSMMNKMRFLPMKIGTLEKYMMEDREELLRVQTDLLSAFGPQQKHFLKRKEISLINRMENNAEKLKEAKAEGLRLQLAIQEVLA